MGGTELVRSGYMIVRKPAFCGYVDGPGPSLDLGQGTGPVPYCGVERSAWRDFNAAHYEQSLPDALERVWEDLQDTKPSRSDFTMTESFSVASSALSFLMKSGEQNEICAVQCSIDPQAPPTAFDADVQWLGTDIYVSGYGSVIRQNIFERPDLFSEFAQEINSHGLFDSGAVAVPPLMERCNSIQPDVGIEMFPPIRHLWWHVLVGRVCASRD